jgi:RNA polymerase sigma-70 factor (ECF subfamily)
VATKLADQSSSEARFRRLYAEHGRDLLGYALRRVPDPEDAADVLADTFLVAWRRIDEVPSGARARLWLFGVARRTIANHHRGAHRRDRLGERLRGELRDLLDHDEPNLDEELTRALSRLEVGDQELLRLTAWEGLTPSQAARALGITAVAARSRLHRARRRLRQALDRQAGQMPATGNLDLEEGR